MKVTQKFILYVGTYTHAISHVPQSKGGGIHQFQLNQATGELTALGVTHGIENPSFVAIDHQQKYLYASTEKEPPVTGTVTAYAIDSASGALTELNTQSSVGRTTAYVSVSATDRYLFVANYMAQPSIAMLPIIQDGHLASASDSHQHTETPNGTVPSRQDSSHAHSIIPSPNNRFVLVCDLGLDKIMVYQLDEENERLIPQTEQHFDAQAGSGPRHIAFHPTQDIVYLANELNSTVAVLTFDPSSGQLSLRQTVTTLPASYADGNWVSDIHTSDDGRFVYIANRGHNSIAIYAVDQHSGELTLIGHESTDGNTPRSFVIDPSGQFILVGNQDSHNIISFKINTTTGLLKKVATTECPTPVCLKMIRLDS